MPSQYNLPRANSQWDVDDVNKYNQLDFYLAHMEAKTIPMWSSWQKFFPSKSWQQNKGDVMRTVQEEFSPIGRQEHVPNLITTLPAKDVFNTVERINEARVRRHNHMSKYIHFSPNFRAFRTNHIPHNTRDISRQIAVAQDFFVRSFAFHNAPYVMAVGAGKDAQGEGEFKTAPVPSGPEVDYTTAKDQDFRAAIVDALPASGGYLDYHACKRASNYLLRDIMAPPFQGMRNAPKDDEVIKGRYCVIGSDEPLDAMSDDEHVLNYKNDSKDVIHQEFSGKIGNRTLWKGEFYPLRMSSDGAFPAPELQVSDAAAFNNNQTVINPAYRDADFEIAFWMGDGSYDIIPVGPPPKEFNSRSMSAEKFHSLSWSGEVRLTDMLLLNYGATQDLNKFGEFVQLIADTVYGAIPVDPRNCLPVIYRRRSPGYTSTT